MFVLPNLFTVSSIFCGVYSITLSAGEPTGDNFYRAAVAIFFGNFFDAFDGRVARLTRTQSDFGVELDSLADVITFGVAPAILVYKWALGGMGLGGIVICAIFAACGAIRLARFNVIAHAESGAQRYFVGLPIPLAAGMLVSLVIALNNVEAPISEAVGLWPIATLVLVLAFLMVSTIRYRTFKDAGLNPRTDSSSTCTSRASSPRCGPRSSRPKASRSIATSTSAPARSASRRSSRVRSTSSRSTSDPGSATTTRRRPLATARRTTTPCRRSSPPRAAA